MLISAFVSGGSGGGTVDSIDVDGDPSTKASTHDRMYPPPHPTKASTQDRMYPPPHPTKASTQDRMERGSGGIEVRRGSGGIEVLKDTSMGGAVVKHFMPEIDGRGGEGLNPGGAGLNPAPYNQQPGDGQGANRGEGVGKVLEETLDFFSTIAHDLCGYTQTDERKRGQTSNDASTPTKTVWASVCRICTFCSWQSLSCSLFPSANHIYYVLRLNHKP
jgi:hypothetical protein